MSLEKDTLGDQPGRREMTRGGSVRSREPDGRLGTVCIYQARDPESIRAHARRVGMPGDEIFPVLKSIVVRDDLAAASAAA